VLSKAFGEVIDGVGELADDDASQFASDTGKDPVLAGLVPILNGRVGKGLDETEYKKTLEEAKRRAEEKRPPGYKDAGRPGDYLIWVETLREAKQRHLDVLIVTGDVKEDWWRQEHGKQRGPRPELAEEMRHFAGTRLFMLRPESLLLHAREILRVEVRDESVQDVERVSEVENGGWTAEVLGEFLSRLSQEGWTAQEHAIRMAALRGGFVEREIVYSLGGYAEGRSLRGFTRPINRIAREFRAQGIIPEPAIDILD
jgi:PIN like domain